MKLVVTSDAHGRGERIKRVLDKINDVDYLLYAGDTVRDLRKVKVSPDIEIIAVKGNCDGRSDFCQDKVVDIGTKRIFLTHGHTYNIKWGLNKLYYKALELKVDIVVFGHTHCRYKEEVDNILFFNPGSIALPRDGKLPSYGVIEINGEKIKSNHFNFDNKFKKEGEGVI